MAGLLRHCMMTTVKAILAVKDGFERACLPRVNPPPPQSGITRSALLERFPRLLEPPGSGVECSEGWFPIVWDLCAAIEALEQLGMPRGTTCRAEGKLGGLFLRLNTSSHIVKELAREAERQAARTCEICGAPGLLRIGPGFAKTLCDADAKIRRVARSDAHVCAGGRPEVIFMDTEFTDLDYPQLISIGLVSEKGERFYVELSNGWSRESCSDFVREQVLPQLVGGDFFQERYYAGRRLTAWLAGHAVPVRVVTDAPRYDWPLMKDLMGGVLPANLVPEPLNFYAEGFPELAPKLLESRKQALRRSTPHHALRDAEALREAWEVMLENVHPAVLEQYLRQF
ncbi:3'-5' exonuclease family protein [Geomesophilobacter sediminis]|uniref:3'-5' exoribonuclease n=1 Tax=Geomesophilobacter sediminis TaxID=2798584 RepID=A0A8J7LY84_9BACT|nr:3'-5' exoribonuclease [Geomesophilobacter sediminis]MBJ6724546.1 3'-5' exoribonuclease [Geomesophilobacter sediminis]